jgi:S1-C subfamily serine protease
MVLPVTGCGTTTSQQAAALTPISVPAFEETKPIAFEKVVLKIPRHEPIGKLSMGTLCIPGGDIRPSGGRYELNTDSFTDIFRQELEAANYTVVGDPDELFVDPSRDRAEFKVAGLVEQIEANVCYPMAGFGDFMTSSGAVFMDVEWQVYDTLNREVVLRFHTQGSSATSADAGGGADLAFDNAFAMATRNLLAEKDFYDLVQGPTRVAARGNVTPTLANLVYDTGTVIDPKSLEQSVVVVRTPDGHGSGFVVSREGHIMTNQHVVGGAEKVKLVFSNGRQVDGAVVSKEPRRDVALIQADLAGVKPLPISSQRPPVGADVYTYGAPLLEEYSGTLRKGIVSSYREERGQEFIQSDAGVNPGNSGGPLLDDSGNVVGISVSGILVDEVASVGVNFFIPIDSALASLKMGRPPF